MLDTAVLAFATLFATISPIDGAAIFAAITVNNTPQERRRIAVRGVIVAAVVLLVFAASGEWLLNTLGISLAALRTAGGVLLLLMGFDMVFARSSANTPTAEEEREAIVKNDVSVFPLALPLIAGPGSMGALILLMAKTEGQWVLQLTVLTALVLVLLITLFCLLAATQLHRLLGITGMQVITRVMGILLCALAVQFIFDGIAESGLLP